MIIFKGNAKIYFYHPKTKCAKVMFLHVSVCPQGGVRTPPWAGTPTQAVTPPGQVHSPWAGAPQQVHPGAGTPHGAVHAGRYGQQAGSTHPTRMYFCCILDWFVAKTGKRNTNYSLIFNIELIGPFWICTHLIFR